MAQYRFYTVYDNNTDEVLIVDGTASECAKRMGMKEESFYSTVSRAQKGTRNRWYIEVTNKEGDTSANEKTNTFGKRIKYHRIQKGLTIRKMAKVIGIHPTCLGFYERDRTCPSLFIATCIADAFGVSLDYLAGREMKTQ